MKIRTISDMRANLQENFDQVHYNKEPIIVTKNRKIWVSIEPLSENDDKELQKLVNQEQHT